MKKYFMSIALVAMCAIMVGCSEQSKKNDLDSLSYAVGANSGLQFTLSEVKFLELDPALVKQGIKEANAMKEVNEDMLAEDQQRLTAFFMSSQNAIYARMMQERMGETDSLPELPELYNEEYTREDISKLMGRSLILPLKVNGVNIDIETYLNGFEDASKIESPEAIDTSLKLNQKQLQEQMRNLQNTIRENYAQRTRKPSIEWLASIEKMDGVKKTKSGILYRIDREGDGEYPVNDSDVVNVHYEGKLRTGEIFDSSYERGESISFPLNRVIKGWTEGMKLINEGGQITLWIPSDLAYGERGNAGGGIGPNEALEFKVELIEVNPEK